MKALFLVLMMLLAVPARPAGPQQAGTPLAKDQVMDWVKAGMETPELVKVIRDHGIGFGLIGDYLQALAKARAGCSRSSLARPAQVSYQGAGAATGGGRCTQWPCGSTREAARNHSGFGAA